MQIEQLKKHGLIAAAVSAAVLLAACDQDGADRAAAPGQPPSQAAGPASGQVPADPATGSADTTAGERAGAVPGAAPGMPPPATTAQGDQSPSLGDRARSATESAQSAAGDAAITAKVKSALVAEDDVRSLAINVDTSDGRVILEGEVPSAEQSMRIEKLAQAVDGVLSVENKLKVVGS